MTPDFWKGKRVLITGHTGFKGSWLSILLSQLGALVSGYALAPPTSPSLFDISRVKDDLENDIRADIRDIESLKSALKNMQPEIVFHMAAQSLVRKSYNTPVDTYTTNVIGTVNLLEACRTCPGIKSIVNVTTDKCYENREWAWGYREADRLGGHDPYSSSKACAELVTGAYRESFLASQNIFLASVRAGNVIGGGDWSQDRLIPDILTAFSENRPVTIRSPQSIRPWQHVLEPLNGYLTLAEKLHDGDTHLATAWNFGPHEEDMKNVEWIITSLSESWGDNASWTIDTASHPHESATLKLDSSRARNLLNWEPRWNLATGLQKVVEWHQAYLDNKDMRTVTRKQIADYLTS